MIDEDATFEQFGYKSTDLKPHSHKKIVVVCDECGKVRVIPKDGYRDLCLQCVCRTEEHRKKLSEVASNMSDETRKKMSAAQKKYQKDHPEAREKTSVARKKYFEDPKAREKNSAAQKKYQKDHPEAREKMSVAKKTYFEDPKAREKLSAAKKKYFEDHPETREKHSATMKKYQKDHPEAREKHSATMKKHYEDPKAREKLSAAKKKYFEDPEARQRLSATKQGISYDEWESFAVDQPYCPAFNETCRESNREKYGRRCFICGKHESNNITKTGKQKRLSVHHVDMDKMQGCDGHRWRLIPTCIEHHGKVHSDLWMCRIIYLLENVYSI